ncbi:MAG: Smr/MutS family protein [Pseudomonadota bacterium]
MRFPRKPATPPPRPDDSDDDAALFRKAVGDVRPVSNRNAPVEKPRPAPRPRQQELDDRAVIDELLNHPLDDEAELDGEHVSYAAPGIQQHVLRKLRRGAIAVQAELDLHGFTVEAARRETAEFIAAARDRDLRCVRVIHGKGRRQIDQAPKLKQLLTRWLPSRPEVLAMCSARAADGGTGALYVLLKRRTDGR